MGVRFKLAQLTATASTGLLKTVFRRPAANFPGKIGLYIDRNLIADLKSRLRAGSIVVVGTNGKTTVTNLLADALEASGWSVACNREGANLDSGIATALLHAGWVDWGVLESDELWLAKTVPQLKPRFVVLVNLFRDQLDRAGEIDHVQAAIVEALASSPATTLIYNADDPLCQAVAERAGNRTIPFGIDEDLKLEQNTVADASMCQRCDALLDYEWRQYGQLGSYRCPSCGFERAHLSYAALDVAVSSGTTTFTVCHNEGDMLVDDTEAAHRGGAEEVRIDVPFAATYMVYNALALYVAARCCGVSPACVNEALRAFDPHNGRLQRYEIDGRHIMLNLAKNPTGFNQNLRIIMDEPGPKVVAFFINDKEADGHDISWLWDIDFQELAGDQSISVCAGGIRRNDMQVRLKYAGIDAQLVDDAEDCLAQYCSGADDPNASDKKFYFIANYTALPGVKAELDRMEHLPEPKEARKASAAHTASAPALASAEKLVIMHLYPELLNLYGDGGNVVALADRARRRGIQTEVVRVGWGQEFDFSHADIVFLGGGPDREQRLASADLLERANDLRAFVEDDGVLLAICGGYQLLGREWLLGNDIVPGMGIVDVATGRAKGGSHNRLVGNIVLKSPLANAPVVGYENHAGRTFLAEGCEPFGRVVGTHGKGNNDADRADGVRYRNVLGTYLHGPLLAKNPEVADWLIERALERRAAKEGRPSLMLAPLDDSYELAANKFMCSKLNVHTR